MFVHLLACGSIEMISTQNDAKMLFKRSILLLLLFIIKSISGDSGESGNTGDVPVENTPVDNAPLPKFECNYETVVQCPRVVKQLGEKCLINNDCAPPGVCDGNMCKCPGALLENEGQCVKAPGLDENCINDKCMIPFVCFRGRCDCPKSMRREDSRCTLECKETEIETIDGCVTVVKLGGKCTTNQQCNAAFSYCKEGVCHCSEGTKAAGESCTAGFNCPDGQTPVKTAKGEMEKCVSLVCPSTTNNALTEKIKLDNCPLNSYCVIPSFQDSEGFCCPEKPYCPMGEALLDKKCTNPANTNERCPPETHHCYAGLRGVYCCPLPCPSVPGQITITYQDKCYTKKEVGESCQVTAQCRHESECINSTCQCAEGFVTQVVDGSGRCRKSCEPNEVLAGRECLDIVAPGQECKISAQCSGGTKCSNGKCICPCNRPMYNGACLDENLCPNFGSGQQDPLLNKKGQLIECVPNSQKFGVCETGYFCSAASVYAGGVCCPLPEPFCDGNRKPQRDRNGKYGFCSERLQTCARNEYCKDYVFEKLPAMQRFFVDGVCCPRNFGFSDIGGDQTNTRLKSNLLTDDMCPPGHRVQVDSNNGQLKMCNFANYANECGLQAACFKINNFNISFSISGVCCKWNG